MSCYKLSGRDLISLIWLFCMLVAVVPATFAGIFITQTLIFIVVVYGSCNFFRLANSIVEQWNRVIWINFVSNYSNSVLNFKTNHRDSWQPKNSQNTIKWVESEKRQKWIGYQQNQKPVYMAHVTYMDGYDEKKVIFIVEDRVISTAVWYEFQSNICIT